MTAKNNPKKSPSKSSHKGGSSNANNGSQLIKQSEWLLSFLGWRDVAWLMMVLAVAIGGRDNSSLSAPPPKSSNIVSSVVSYILQETEQQEGQPRNLANDDNKQDPKKACTITQERVVHDVEGTRTESVVRHISPYCFNLPLFNIHSVPVFSRRTCQKLIAAAERKNEWTGMSAFGAYQATRDVSLDTLGPMLDAETIAELEKVVGGVLGKYITTHFLDQKPELDGKFNNMHMEGHTPDQDQEQRYSDTYNYDTVVRLKGTPFIIRYDAEEIDNVKWHKDNAEVSFVILLSDPREFEGGGTVFQVMGDDDTPILLKQGEALVFNGQLVHGAKSITQGRRYVLSGFTRFDEAYMDVKRRGTMASTVMID